MTSYIIISYIILGGTYNSHCCKPVTVFLIVYKCSHWLFTFTLMPQCQFISCTSLVQFLHATRPDHLNLAVTDRDPKLTPLSHLMICEVGTAVTSGEISKHCWTNFTWFWCWWWKAKQDLKLWKSPIGYYKTDSCIWYSFLHLPLKVQTLELWSSFT